MNVIFPYSKKIMQSEQKSCTWVILGIAIFVTVCMLFLLYSDVRHKQHTSYQLPPGIYSNVEMVYSGLNMEDMSSAHIQEMRIQYAPPFFWYKISSVASITDATIWKVAGKTVTYQEFIRHGQGDAKKKISVSTVITQPSDQGQSSVAVVVGRE